LSVTLKDLSVTLKHLSVTLKVLNINSCSEEKHPNLHPSKSWTKYDYDEEIRPAIHRIYSYFKKKYGWSFKLVERAFKLLWEDRVKNYHS